MQDAETLDPDEGEKIGICFAVPKISINSDNVESLIYDWLEGVKKIKCSAIAWSFPKKTRKLKMREDGIFFYPGVVLLMQAVADI